jgi:hypothetical protein
MPSLVDIFNPSFFMFLGIMVLVAALLVVYFESKMREQNHKMTSMLNLITCMAEEMNVIKTQLNHEPRNFGIGGSHSQFQPSSLETNNIHIVKTDLIAVSDDSDSESDNDYENSVEDNESDSGSDSGSESNSEDIEEVQNIIEIGENPDIKVLKLNLSNINDIDENKDANDFEEIGDLEFIDEDEDDDNLSLGSVSVSSNEEDNKLEIENVNDNDEIDISKLNLKSINISSLEEVKNTDNIDYKKLTLSKLRSIVVEKELVADSSKLKKNELLKMLGAE